MANIASVLPIIRKGHPGLEIVASPVPLLPKNNDIKAQDDGEHEHEQVRQLHAQLIDQLRDTLLSTGSAVGLAATQINVPYRAIAFRIPVERSDDGKTEVPLTIAFNPVIEPLMDEDEDENDDGDDDDDESGGSDVNEKKRKKNIVYGFEACLSLPGLMGRVPRYNHIRYHYTDAVTGEHVTREVSGFHSRLIQHECDHLDGITYVQRMDDMTMFGYVEEMKKYKVDMEKDLVDED